MAGPDPGTDANPSPEGATPAPFRLRYSAVSDVGRHRKENQDSGYASEHLLVIADGVGGAAYGDVASATAVHLLRRLDKEPDGEMLPALAGAVHRIHDKLAEMVEQDEELDGTSTTVTAALFDGNRLGFVHVGDSRAYLRRDGHVRQLTKDHTFVQTLVDDGRITEADSRVHPHRNIILRAVDGVQDTEPDLFHLDVRAGDRVLLCSDGCSGVLDDHDLEPLLGAETVDAAAVALVRASLDAGTTDNVTVVVAEVVPAGAEDEPDTSAQAAVGPMLVGAAADQPRRGGVLSRALFRHRQSDTGEIEPVAGPAADDERRVDPEELRYAPRPPRRRTGLRRAAYAVLVLLVLAGVLGAGYAWSQTQYYVAADGDRVAIYRGVQVDVPGVDLSHPVEVVDGLTVASLPPAFQEQVSAGIVADDLSDARRIVADLTDQVAPCSSPRPSASATPRKRHTARPGSGAAGKTRSGAGSSATPRATSTRTPAPTPSRTPSAAPSPSRSRGTGPGTGSEPCGSTGTSS